MASWIAKKVGMRMAGPALQNAIGSQSVEDPYFEQVPVKDRNGHSVLDREGKVKTKKRRKGLPAGISDNDGQVLTAVKRSAYRLDLSLFTCCGIRFGWSSVIGIIPFIGDSIEVMLAYRVLKKAEKIDGGLPSNVRMRMMINILIDFAIGFVPFLGDVADAVYKCNTKNAAILEKHLREKGVLAMQSQGQATPAVPIDAPVTFDLEEREHKENQAREAQTSGVTDATYAGASNTSAADTNSPVVPSVRAGRNSWFGGRSKQVDPESIQGAPPRYQAAQIPIVPAASTTSTAN